MISAQLLFLSLSLSLKQSFLRGVSIVFILILLVLICNWEGGGGGGKMVLASKFDHFKDKCEIRVKCIWIAMNQRFLFKHIDKIRLEVMIKEEEEEMPQQ